MSKDLNEIALDGPTQAPDGKEIITLNDFLNRYLKQPEHEAEALRLNATNILKVLGLQNVSQAEARQATKWLRANGFRAVHQGKVFRVAMRYPQTAHCHVVF